MQISMLCSVFGAWALMILPAGQAFAAPLAASSEGSVRITASVRPMITTRGTAASPSGAAAAKLLLRNGTVCFQTNMQRNSFDLLMRRPDGEEILALEQSGSQECQPIAGRAVSQSTGFHLPRFSAVAQVSLLLLSPR